MAAEYSPRSLTVYGVPIILGTAVSVTAVVLAVPEPERVGWHWLIVGLAALGLAGVLSGLCRRAGREVVGPADLVTFVRAGGVAVVASWAVLSAVGVLEPTSWWLTGVACAALLLDGVDGAVARRLGQPTTGGARLDAETDAIMMLALAVIVAGQVGGWLVLAGALRYLFAAGVALRYRRRGRPVSLPRRSSRRVVAATSASLLAAATAPVLAGVPATVAAGGALVLLLASFAADVLALERGLRGRVVGEVVGGSTLQGGVDPSHVLAQDPETEQLQRTDGRHDHHR
jgi:phosphatidylglycerophosphate synthase